MTVTRILILSMVSAFAANAQTADSARVGFSLRSHSETLRATSLPNITSPETTSTIGGRTAIGALIGAGVGAAAGVVVAFIATHASNVSDHSEDGIAYVYLGAVGALVGLVVGAVAGSRWK